MSHAKLPALSLAAALAGCAAAPAHHDNAGLVQQVMATERAFAASMRARDHAAFTSFLSDEAVFFSSDKVLRGKPEVAAAWRRFFEQAAAPFSWEPDKVEVLDSGTLALSSGPVRDPQGKLIARFTSVWRLDSSGAWRIVFDQGNDVCRCAAP